MEGEWARDCVFHVIDLIMKSGKLILKAKIKIVKPYSLLNQVMSELIGKGK